MLIDVINKMKELSEEKDNLHNDSEEKINWVEKVNTFTNDHIRTFVRNVCSRNDIRITYSNGGKIYIKIESPTVITHDGNSETLVDVVYDRSLDEVFITTDESYEFVNFNDIEPDEKIMIMEILHQQFNIV